MLAFFALPVQLCPARHAAHGGRRQQQPDVTSVEHANSRYIRKLEKRNRMIRDLKQATASKSDRARRKREEGFNTQWSGANEPRVAAVFQDTRALVLPAAAGFHLTLRASCRGSASPDGRTRLLSLSLSPSPPLDPVRLSHVLDVRIAKHASLPSLDSPEIRHT